MLRTCDKTGANAFSRIAWTYAPAIRSTQGRSRLLPTRFSRLGPPCEWAVASYDISLSSATGTRSFDDPCSSRRGRLRNIVHLHANASLGWRRSDRVCRGSEDQARRHRGTRDRRVLQTRSPLPRQRAGALQPLRFGEVAMKFDIPESMQPAGVLPMRRCEVAAKAIAWLGHGLSLFSERRYRWARSPLPHRAAPTAPSPDQRR